MCVLTAPRVSLDYLIERIWAELDLVKVYTKKRGAHPDLADPICLRKGATIEVLQQHLIFVGGLIGQFVRLSAMAFIDPSRHTSAMH